MGNPLKKTMVFLGLAEEEFDEHGMPHDSPPVDIDAAAAPPLHTPRQNGRAPVTPLRKMHPVRPSPAPPMNEIVTVHPTEYNDAAAIAENFRNGVPVILNLSRMRDADAKRLIDFASGLTMGLHGKIERVTGKVFLISPEHIVTNASPHSDHLPNEPTSFFVESDGKAS